LHPKSLNGDFFFSKNGADVFSPVRPLGKLDRRLGKISKIHISTDRFLTFVLLRKGGIFI